MFYYTKTYLRFQPTSDRAMYLSLMINVSVSLFASACLIRQIDEVNHKTILDLTFKQLVACLGYLWLCTTHTLYMSFAPAFKHLCITNGSLQRDLHLKVQHLICDLHLMMLCIQGVSLSFSFVILHSNSLL